MGAVGLVWFPSRFALPFAYVFFWQSSHGHSSFSLVIVKCLVLMLLNDSPVKQKFRIDAHATARCFPEWQFVPMVSVCFPAAKCSSILAEMLRLAFASHSRNKGVAHDSSDDHRMVTRVSIS